MAEDERTFLRERKALLISILLAAVTFCTYLPSLSNGFVGMDDPAYVYGNPHVRGGLAWENMRWALTAYEKSLWHPVTMLSIQLDCQLFGLKPAGHHLTSLLLHCANTVLLFLLLHGLSGALWRSAFVAALFALHPLHVESVAWAAERKDVLSGFFFMLTLLAYARYAEEIGDRRQEIGAGARKWVRPAIFYLLSSIFFLLGLMSKPMLVTVPFVLLLLDYWPLRRLQLKINNLEPRTLLWLVWEKIPFFAASFAAGLVTIHAQRASGAFQGVTRLPVTNRLANAVISYAQYLFQMVWPANMAVYYPYPKSFSGWVVAGSAALLLGVSWLATKHPRSRPYLAVGWVWYLVTLLPVSGMLQVGQQARADRFTYLPFIGVFMLVAWGAYDLTRRCGAQKAALSVAGTAATALCIGLTYRQVGFWKDSETLFGHALAVTADNDVAHNNLGTALLDLNRPAEAIPHFEEAVRLRPGDPSARRNLGTALFRAGRLDESIVQLELALKLKPDMAIAHSNLGTALGMKGRMEEAIAHLREAVRLLPGDLKAENNLGVALARAGRFEEAIPHFREVIRLDPGSPTGHLFLAGALRGLGRFDEAIREFQEALKLAPGDQAAQRGLQETLAAKAGSSGTSGTGTKP